MRISTIPSRCSEVNIGLVPWGSIGPTRRSAAPATLSEDQVAPYTALMAASQPLVSSEILVAYSFSKHRCLLDVGGGDGTFLTTVAASAPALQLMLFDLPTVAERAKTRFLNNGLADRARAVGGDFLRDPIPTGADIITLVRVVHDHDDASVVALLTAIRRALPVDGVLLIAEPMAETPGAEPMGDAYFGFYLLAMGRGRPRTATELEQLLHRTGFKRIRTVPTRMPLQTCLILAHPG